MGRDVFISHVEENSDIATAIADGLEAAGFSTWYYERDSLPGPSYLLQTSRAIEDSKAMLLIISPHSLGSYQVTKEVIRAHESGKPFLPVLKSITHVEFGTRQPEWREAVGSATSIPVPAKGVGVIVPRIIEGLKGLGVAPSEGSGAAGVPTGEFRVADIPSARPHRPARIPLWPKLLIATLIVAVAATSGVMLLSKEKPRSQNNTQSSTTTFPGIVQEVSSPSPEAEFDATTTAIQTSIGPLMVSSATLTNEVCPPPEIPERCKTTSGENRYLVLDLRSAEGGDVSLNTVFTGEAHGSVVSFEGRRAGGTSVYLDESEARIQVVYGVLPASSAQGKLLLHWPENPALRLTPTS